MIAGGLRGGEGPRRGDGWRSVGGGLGGGADWVAAAASRVATEDFAKPRVDTM
jgi:hypothetical protein